MPSLRPRGWRLPGRRAPSSPVRPAPALREIDLAGHEALVDQLTGLANRRALHRRLEEALAEPDARAALLLLDVDAFKDVNDTLGHDAGDLVLRQVARRLEHVALEADLLARVGGDEFAVLLTGDEADDASALGRRLRGLLEAPLEVEGLGLRLGSNIGIALAPRHANDATGLARRADVAMHLAKTHRTSIEVYSPERDRHSPARLALTAELHGAIEAGQLEVHYQPQADVRTGAVRGVEALVRWRHPEHGLMPPAAFMPLAERAGIMGPLALLVLEQAVVRCARWRAAGHDFTIAVNLSVTNLMDPDLPAEIAALLSEAGLAPRHLELEITEDVVMADAVGPIGVLHELKELGVRLSLDDFGTGYSSMAYLKHLAVDALKIDRSFVRDMADSHEDAAIVRSIVALAHALDLEVVAEGVATQRAWFAARDAGCDVAQGFHLGRPMAAEGFDAWLDEHVDRAVL
ncbi:putative signaling protein [Baekduia alba]|uniref:putative bifunctional diguanylate cyclase/phosphodiesterase n=1 Tax=Baekduia alba TaxID=2997333 RepID=UPI002340EFF8|nr:EAL domain-containing protein [Baekduia alba]WCB92678.1 putative signaling protein [Baekduia alba]